jgi:hypothetical protein
MDSFCLAAVSLRKGDESERRPILVHEQLEQGGGGIEHRGSRKKPPIDQDTFEAFFWILFTTLLHCMTN